MILLSWIERNKNFTSDCDDLKVKLNDKNFDIFLLKFNYIMRKYNYFYIIVINNLREITRII